MIKGKIVSRVEMGQILGVSLPTLDSYVDKGCPILLKGGKGTISEFNTHDVISWLIQHESSRAVKKMAGAFVSKLIDMT